MTGILLRVLLSARERDLREPAGVPRDLEHLIPDPTWLGPSATSGVMVSGLVPGGREESMRNEAAQVMADNVPILPLFRQQQLPASTNATQLRNLSLIHI